MDPYASEFSGLTLSFESELSAFLELPANGGNAAPSDGGTTTNNLNGLPYHQGYGQLGGRDAQCTGCAKYKLDLDRMRHEHQINFQLLKKKIINTDAVLRKCKEQKDYCERLHAEAEEFRRKLDQASRETDILSQQLSTSIANIKPLQEEKERLQAQLTLKSSQIIELSDRLEGDKALKLQRSAQDEYNRNLEIEVTKLKKSNATLTTRIRVLDSKVKDLNAEKRCLMCSKHVVERRLDNLALALHEAEEACQRYWDKLQKHDLAAGKKKPTFIPNGFKSLVRRAVDKKNGIFTENISESGAEEDGDDNISVHSVARNDDSDLDNISDVDSEGDSNVTSPKRDGPEKPNKDTELPTTSKSAVTSQKHQSPPKQVENDKTTSPQLNKYSQMLPQSSENIPQKPTSKSEQAESHREIQDATGKLYHSKQAMPCSNHSQKPVGETPRKDLVKSIKLPETMKTVSEGPKEDKSSRTSDRSKAISILRSNTKIASASDRTNLNQNSKNRNFDSLDDDSLSSLSSLSSSDDDDNDIDDFLNIGCTSDRKEQGVDLDTAFSFAEIQNLLSPLSVSPRPVSSLSSRSMPPLSPCPVPLLSLQAASELSTSTHPASSSGSSLSDEDSADEGDTTTDCLFANKSASPERYSPAHGDKRKKMYASEKPHISYTEASKSASRDGGCQALIVSRSQSLGFTPATDDDGRTWGLDVLDESISDSVAVLEDVNISDDIIDAKHVTDSCVLENVSNNATLVNTSNSGYSSNSAAVMGLSISENICNITASPDESMMDTCVEVYILKNVSPAAVDKLDTQTEVGLGVTNTCDNKSVIKVTQASDMELALPQMHQSLSTQFLDLRSPLSQALDTQSLDLKPSPPLLQTLDTQSVDLKSSPLLFQTYHSLDTKSLDFEPSPPLLQVYHSLDTQSVDLKSSLALPQTHISSNMRSSNLNSSTLSETNTSLDSRSLDLKSSALPRTHQLLNTQALDLEPSSSLSSNHHSLNSQVPNLESFTSLLPNDQSLDKQASGIRSSSTVPQMHSSLNGQATDIESSLTESKLLNTKTSDMELPSVLQSLNTKTSNMESLSAVPQSLNTKTSDIKSSFVSQSSNTNSSDIKSPSTVPQSSNTKASDIKSPSTVPQSLNTKSSDIKSPTTVPQSLNTNTSNIKSPSTVPQSSNTKAADMQSSTVTQSLNTNTSDIKSPSTVPQSLNINTSDIKSPSTVTQSLNTNTSDIKSPSTVPQSSNTKASDIKSPSTVPFSLNTKASDIKSPTTVPQSLNINTSDIKSPSTVTQSLITKAADMQSSTVTQSLNSNTSDIKSPSTVPQSLNINTSDIKSPSTVTQSLITKAADMQSSTVPQSLNINTSDIKSPSTVTHSLITKAADMQSSTVTQSLNTNTSDIKSPSTVPQSLNTNTSDIKSPSTVTQSLITNTSDINSSSTVLQSLNTKTSDINSPSSVPQSLNTKTSDIKSPSTVTQSLNTKAADMQSSTVTQSLNTKASDIKSPSTLSQYLNTNTSDIKSLSVVPQSLNTKAADMQSSSVSQPLKTNSSVMESPTVSQSLNTKSSDMEPTTVTQSLNTKSSDMEPSTVPQSLKRNTSGISSLSTVRKSLKRKASDMESSPTLPLVHQLLITQTSGIKSPSAMPQKRQSLRTKASDIKPSSAIPQKHQLLCTKTSYIKPSSLLAQRPQTLLLDVFDFFSLPPPLSPLPQSPCPHNQNEDTPLIKFSSAVPANVPKVTPSAQIERKARIGNSSMSFQINEAKKLMAKRKAAVAIQPGSVTNGGERKRTATVAVTNGSERKHSETVAVTNGGEKMCTPTVAVTNGGERKRTATVAEVSPAVPTKKKKLADLSGFPNANAAVMYDLRQFLTAKDLDLKVTAETMLGRVEEGNTKAAWETLCEVTITYLEATHQDVLINLISACEKKGIIDTVFIREDERRLLLLISAFWRLDEKLDRQYLMGKIWAGIFNRDCSNQLVRLSYCRMFTSLCLKQGDVEQVRILLYNIACCDYLDLIHPLMAIVGVWPQVLACGYKSNESCIKKVLRFILRDKCRADNSLLHKVTLVLQRVCQFDLDKKEESPEKLLKSLLNTQLLHKVKNTISGTKLDQTFEAMKTIELLLVYQGPEWTEKHFMKSSLVSFTMRWENRRLDKTGPPDQLITCLLRIFRAVIAVQPLSTSCVAAVLGTVFHRFMNCTAGDTDLRSTYIDALLDLAPYSPDKCLDLLKKWQATQSNIPAETLSKLQEAQSLLSNEVFLTNHKGTKRFPPPKNKKGKKQKKPK